MVNNVFTQGIDNNNNIFAVVQSTVSDLFKDGNTNVGVKYLLRYRPGIKIYPDNSLIKGQFFSKCLKQFL